MRHCQANDIGSSLTSKINYTVLPGIKVSTDEAGLFVFATDPAGKPTVIVVPDKVTAEDLIEVLEAEGWTIQNVTFEVEFIEDDES